MFLALCYAVIDPARREIRWVNAGQPHCFVLDADGAAHRLAATDPPLGMAAGAPHEASRPWDPTRDTLERTFVRPAVEYLGERFAWTLRAFQALTVLVALQTLLLLWLLFRTRPGPAP